MSMWDKSHRQIRHYRPDNQNPSFSSTLLDEIYRSIDGEGGGGCGTTTHDDLLFYREKLQKKQSKSSNNGVSEEKNHMIDTWTDTKTKMEKHSSRKSQKQQMLSEFKRKPDHDHEHDSSLFFSSTSCSSDSSSGGFSSSDTEMYKRTRSKSSSSCFAPSKPKPLRTTTTSTAPPPSSRNNQHKPSGFLENYGTRTYHEKHEDGLMLKSKSKAGKKVKPPVSPGSKLASFLNSLFTTGIKTRKTSSKKASPISSREENGYYINGEEKSTQVSECSSASSFSRSCLSKNSPCTRERLRNGVQRTVRFYPAEEKCVIGKEDGKYGRRLMPAPIETQESPDRKFAAAVNSRRSVEEMAREILKDYEKKINDKCRNMMKNEYDESEDDDAASCSSSDLFELDFIGKDRYCEELPVYETTDVSTNRAIANSFMM